MANKKPGKYANKKKSGKTTARNYDPKNGPARGSMSGKSGGVKVTKMHKMHSNADKPSAPGKKKR